MSLDEEVTEHRKSIRTDGYPMSIGELAAMYKEGDLELHPEFQRFFRWTPQQKSRLIESILLGIPLPSVFVHQRADGVWDVVDGLQRLSSIFEVMGLLRHEDGELAAPLRLSGTKYLPSLDGRTWGTNEADPMGLGGTLQRLLKRSKIDIKIVLRESDSDTRLELFQRLNTGGTPLSAQELRNCQILMVGPSTLDRLRGLASADSFARSLALSDRNIDEQYDLELAIRFITLRKRTADGIGDLGSFLDDAAITLAQDTSFDWEAETQVFQDTFNALDDALGDDAFRRYDPAGDRFLGGFLVSAFEVLALGLGYHFQNSSYELPDLRAAAVRLWTDTTFAKASRGRAAEDRLRNTLPYGRTLLANE